MKSARPSTAAVWLSALRPKTLGASLCPVLMGGALAYHDGALKDALQWQLVGAAFVGACLLQIASNFANDLFDGLRGTDSGERQVAIAEHPSTRHRNTQARHPSARDIKMRQVS